MIAKYYKETDGRAVDLNLGLERLLPFCQFQLVCLLSAILRVIVYFFLIFLTGRTHLVEDVSL